MNEIINNELPFFIEENITEIIGDFQKTKMINKINNKIKKFKQSKSEITILKSWSSIYKHEVDSCINDEQEFVENCIICLSDYNNEEKFPEILNCGHTFCKECVTYICNSRKCPICKKYTNKDSIKNFALYDAIQKHNRFSKITNYIIGQGLSNQLNNFEESTNLNLSSNNKDLIIQNERLKRLNKINSSCLNKLCTSSDSINKKFSNSYFATSSCDKSIKIWGNNYEPIINLIDEYEVRSFIQLSLEFIVSGNVKGQIKLWSMKKKTLLRIVYESKSPVLKILKINSHEILCIFESGLLSLVNLLSGEEISSIFLESRIYTSIILDNQISLVTKILVAGEKGEIFSIDIYDSYMTLTDIFNTGDKSIYSLLKINNSKVLYGTIGVNEIKIRLFNIQSKECLKKFSTNQDGNFLITSIVKLNSNYIVNSDNKGNLYVWNYFSNELLFKANIGNSDIIEVIQIKLIYFVI